MKISKMKKTSALIAAASALLFSCSSISTATKVTARILNESGVISESTVDAIDNSVDTLEAAKTSFSLEEEYYIGRGVAASILSKYNLYKNEEATEYASSIMYALIENCDAAEMFNGYHLAILDTEEINAFATSGGHILVTRGLMKITENEDQLACVIAHELAHIQKNHSIKSISSDRKKNAWKSLGTAALLTTADIVETSKDGIKNNRKNSDNIAELQKVFSGIVGESIDNLINNGYSQKFEYEADAEAVNIVNRTGYNVSAMGEMLTHLESKTSSGSTGFGKTHPKPSERKKKLADKYYKTSSSDDSNIHARAERFAKAKKSF